MNWPEAGGLWSYTNHSVKGACRGDHRRGESLGKPILINPLSLVGATARRVWCRLFRHVVLLANYQSCALFRVHTQE